MQAVEVETIAVQHGRGYQIERDLVGAVFLLQVFAPDFFTGKVEAGDDAAGVHHPDVLAVGDRRYAGHIPLATADFFVFGAKLMLPELLAGGVVGQRVHGAAIGGGQEDVLAVNCRRGGSPSGDFGAPGQCLCRRSIRWRRPWHC